MEDNEEIQEIKVKVRKQDNLCLSYDRVIKNIRLTHGSRVSYQHLEDLKAIAYDETIVLKELKKEKDDLMNKQHEKRMKED